MARLFQRIADLLRGPPREGSAPMVLPPPAPSAQPQLFADQPVAPSSPPMPKRPSVRASAPLIKAGQMREAPVPTEHAVPREPDVPGS